MVLFVIYVFDLSPFYGQFVLVFFLIHLEGSSIVFGVILEFDLDPAKVPESEPLFKICTVQSFY